MDDMTGKGWTTIEPDASRNNQLGGLTGVFVHSPDQLYVVDMLNSRTMHMNFVTGKGWTRNETLNTISFSRNKALMPHDIYNR
jgi:hypothetical protein